MIRLVMASWDGPTFYDQPTLKDALQLLAKWSQSECAPSTLSVWRKRGKRWECIA